MIFHRAYSFFVGGLGLTSFLPEIHFRPLQAQTPADSDGYADHFYYIFFDSFSAEGWHEFDFFASQVPDDHCAEGVIVGGYHEKVIVFADHLNNFFAVINGG